MCCYAVLSNHIMHNCGFQFSLLHSHKPCHLPVKFTVHVESLYHYCHCIIITWCTRASTWFLDLEIVHAIALYC